MIFDLNQSMFGGPGVLDLGRPGISFVQSSVSSNRVRAPLIIVGDTITMSCNTDGATIYYTTDGSIPDATDTEYTEAITLPEETTTYKAIAIKSDMDDSAITTKEYTTTVAGLDYDGSFEDAYNEAWGEYYEETWV